MVIYSVILKSRGFLTARFGKGLPQELCAAYDTCFLVTLPHFLDEEHAFEEVAKQPVSQKIYIQKKLKSLAAEITQKGRGRFRN